MHNTTSRQFHIAGMQSTQLHSHTWQGLPGPTCCCWHQTGVHLSADHRRCAHTGACKAKCRDTQNSLFFFKQCDRQTRVTTDNNELTSQPGLALLHFPGQHYPQCLVIGRADVAALCWFALSLRFGRLLIMRHTAHSSGQGLKALWLHSLVCVPLAPGQLTCAPLPAPAGRTQS